MLDDIHLCVISVHQHEMNQHNFKYFGNVFLHAGFKRVTFSFILMRQGLSGNILIVCVPSMHGFARNLIDQFPNWSFFHLLDFT